jgi:ABC-type bacteriocin/lantibiotic exporter with double-glycine peptidase domain
MPSKPPLVCSTLLLDIPWMGQRFDPQRWAADGFEGPEDSLLWSDRACGIACLRMILAYYGLPVPDTAEMLRLGLDIGAYCDRGWVHRGLVELGRHYGLSGKAEPADLGLLARAVACGMPPIVSVTHKLPTDGRKGGHLVVFAGVSVDGTHNRPPVVHLRDPSRWGRQNDRVQVPRFLSSFSGRAVLFWPHEDERECRGATP